MGVLFGECKTYSQFDGKDFERMRNLATLFPGAVLAFATLRKSLTAPEIRQITRIAKAGMKYWRADRPVSPVLILTATELLNWDGPPQCWSEELKKFDHVHGLPAHLRRHPADLSKPPILGGRMASTLEKKRQRRVVRMEQENK